MERLGFLCVLAGALRVAIPLNLVLSVEEAGPLTPLPFSPDLVEGLVMAVGRVLPQMSLTAALGEAGRDGGVLVVVAASDDVRALRVDQVAGMVQVDVQAIESAGAAGHAGPGEAQAGRPLLTARFTALGAEWHVLDYVRLTADQPMAPAEIAGGAALVAAAGEAPDSAPRPADGGDERLLLLVVEIADESYAVPTAAIVEILVPGVIRSMPGSPAWVVGLIDRRGSPLLVLSTATLLGRPSTAGSTIVLVIEVPGVGGVGILVDRAIGIERVDRSDIHAVTQEMAGVANYFVIASEHIIGIIDPPALTAQVSDALGPLVPRDAISADAVQVVAATKPSRKLLALRVGRELFALPLDRVERIQASVVLTPLPQPGNGFHAMADVGDASVPVLDLRRRIAHAGSDPTPPCTLVQIEGALAGLAVDQVLRIEDIPNADIEDVATHPLLPVSHVARSGQNLLSVLVIDRVLPPLPNLMADRPARLAPR
jgi:chemotaxis signal transduction protein